MTRQGGSNKIIKLHHAGSKPDWVAVPLAGRNPWQRIAARTHGVLTPGNITSLVGVALVALGLYYVANGVLWQGLAVLAAGRLLDIADGTLAEATGTKSPLGESVDASLDKIAAFAALAVFTGVGILPLPFALLIGVENGITSLLGLAAKGTRRAIHPIAAGKIGGALEWVALLGFVLGAAVQANNASIFTTAAYVAATISVVLNGYATLRYAHAFRAR